ncbi:hypothetical protein AALP_AA5G068700 [Arabis alpina]|uniref:CCHC-type domain-containing protein n=1 Tax=Arabis alpina TaxID=50452 RepID=A0A087GVF1_ARAAL|nr:hypothetical protein AALP_AA5G068700 [Arabis alpina]
MPNIFDQDKEDPVAIRDDNFDEEEDDDEANEDLSLQILEKALSRRDFDDSKDSSISDLCSSGVVDTVMVNGGNSKKMKKASTNEISIVENDEVETKPGETSSNLVLKKLLRGARYFDPPDAGWVSCYSCGEQGHITVNCPTPTKRRKPCFICGSLEHGAKQCSKGQDCYICKKGGHRAKDCPDKYKSGSKTAVCLRCGDFGHDMILCKYEYSQADLKDIQCYVCKSFGHLCCVEPGNSQSWAVSCYRCGQLGHIGLACGRHLEESTENNSASLCFRCGEEGHFSRECPNSSSISTSQGRESPSLCYRCDGVGHFARECPNSSQVSKRIRETSTPSRSSRKKNKGNPEHDSTPHESNGKKKKKDKEYSEHNSTPHETNRKAKKKDKEYSEQNSTPHQTNGKAKKKDIENSEQNSTPYETNGKAKKKNKENSERNSIPHESNGKSKKKKKKHKGEQSQTTPQQPRQRGGWITEDPEEDSFQRGKIRRPRSPITPSGYNHDRLPVTPPHNNYDRYPATYMGNNHRSPTFNSGGHFPGYQSITPYGRNHRDSSFESSRHFSGPPPSRWQADYPSSRQQQQRYAPAPPRYAAPPRYGPTNYYYDRW